MNGFKYAVAGLALGMCFNMTAQAQQLPKLEKLKNKSHAM